MRSGRWKRALSVAFGVLISASAVWALVDRIDLSAFARISSRIQPEYLLLFLLAIGLAHCVNGLRWYVLLAGSVSFVWATITVIIGVGANQALPARGGDLVRLYMTDRLTGGEETGMVAGRMFVEKVLESSSVITLGLVALLYAGERLGPGWAEHSGALLAAYAIVVSTIYVSIRKRNEAFLRAAEWIFRRIGLVSVFETRVRAVLEGLGRGMSVARVLRPLLLTLLLWLGPYVLMYYAVGALLQQEFGYAQILLLVCASAVGNAIPAAPSGVGVLHAALVSAFVVMGRGTSEGLLFAVAAHLLAFLLNALLAIGFYFAFRNVTRRRGKESGGQTAE